MEKYIVSARKYRPTTFATVVGQQALTSTLKNAIDTNRLAHAYLFCGSRGVGKTSCARIFAKTINCTNRTSEGEACNECDSCRQFNENRSMNILELDAASNNSVDDIRQLCEQVVVPPTMGRYRVFIVDEVHMLSPAAFNAFLKTLEEPPEHAVFILATTEKHKILPTILSRCQIYDFKRITIDDMVDHLRRVAAQEGYTTEDEALNVIAQKADGAMRDALSIFDQVAASTRGNITYEATIKNLNVLDHSYYNRLLDAFVSGDVPTALLVYKEIREKGFDSQFFINGLAQYLRDLAVSSSPATSHLVEATEQVRRQLAERSAKLHPTFLYRAMELCNSADFNFRQASNKQFLVELTLIKLCQLLSPSPDNSGEDVGHLKPLAAGAPTPVPAGTPQTHAPAPAPVQSQQPTPPSGHVSKFTHNPQPRPASTATAKPHQSISSSLNELSLGKLRESMATGTPAPTTSVASPSAQPVQTAGKDFTDADVERVWPIVLERAQFGPMMNSVFAQARPAQKSGKVYTLTIATEMQASLAEKEIDRLQKDMRKELKNDGFRFEIEVMTGELPKNLRTDDRVLADLIEEHPGLKQFIDKYQLRRM